MSFLATLRHRGPFRAHPNRATFLFLATLVVVALAIAGVTVALTPWKIFAAIITLVCIVIVVYRPQAIVLFLAIYTPFEPFLLKFVSDDIYLYARYFSEGLVYLVVAVVIARMILKKIRHVPTPIDLPFICFLLVAVTSLIINAVPVTIGVLGIRQIIRFILLFFAIVHLAPPKEFVKKLTVIMLGIVLLQGLLGLTQSLANGRLDSFLIPSERRFFESVQLTTGTNQTWSPGTRVFATLGRYDQLGTFLCFFFALIIGLLYYETDPQRRRTLWIVLITAFPALVLTLSRASWFGFLLALIVISAIIMKDRRVRISLLFAVVAAMIYAASSSLVVRYLIDYPEQTVTERLLEAFSYERWRGEYYGIGRVYWVVQTVSVVVPSAPLFGVGPGQYGGGAVAALGNTSAYEKLNLPFGVYGTEGYIDNNWFSLWGEVGTLGVVFYGLMMLALFKMAYRIWRTSSDPLTRGLALGYIGCIVAITFQSFLATYLEVRTLALYFWLYGGLLYSLDRQTSHANAYENRSRK